MSGSSGGICMPRLIAKTKRAAESRGPDDFVRPRTRVSPGGAVARGFGLLMTETLPLRRKMRILMEQLPDLFGDEVFMVLLNKKAPAGPGGIRKRPEIGT